MKLTKFVHACVLVEDNDKSVLFDPGEFSWKSGLLKIDDLKQLDRIVISHEHFDHFHMPFVEALKQKFPQARVISTPEVVRQLQEKGSTDLSSESDDLVSTELGKHVSMEPFAPPPCDNLHTHALGKVSHPGDTLDLSSSKDVLLLPLAGPWASTVEAIRMADKLKPKVILPIHDWMWNDQWKQDMYGRMEEFFAKSGIRFIKAVDGETYEV